MKAKAATLLVVSLLAACEDGSITLSVADAPIDDAERVVVQFRSVVFEQEDGTRQTVALEPAQSIDLSALTGGESEALVSARAIPPGNYRAIEFVVGGSSTTQESYVDFTDGTRRSLFVPTASRNGLRVPVDFEIREEEDIALTVDFDLRRSLFIASERVELRPALRAVFDDEVGIVSGRVAASLLPSGCSPAVYIYEGANATPDDIGGSGTQPLSSSLVRLDNATGDFRYAIGFIEAGSYTLALTCDADLDAPDRNDDIRFTGRRADVRVEAGRTRTVDLQ